MLGLGIALGRGSAAAGGSLRATNRLVALVGNSLSEQIYSQTGSQDARAYGTWINILSHGRMRIERDLVFARSGYTSAQLEPQLAAAIASRAQTVIVHVTTNDCRSGAGTINELRARYRGWKARLRAAGKLQIWCDGQPRADSPGGDYVAERNAQLRDLVWAEMDDPAMGSFVAPSFASIGDYPGSVLPATDMLRGEALHSAYSGAHAVASAIVAVATPLFAPFDPLNRPDTTTWEAGFAGGGANVAPSSGTAEGGNWSISASAGITWEMVDDPRGERWIEFTVDDVVDAAIVMTGPSHAALVGNGRMFVPGATRVEASALWRIRDGHANARVPRCFLYDSGGQTMPYDLAAGTVAEAGATVGPAIDATDEGSAGTMRLPPGGIAGLLNPWAGTLRANANRVMPLLAWYGVSGQPARARVAFARPQIRIVG